MKSRTVCTKSLALVLAVVAGPAWSRATGVTARAQDTPPPEEPGLPPPPEKKDGGKKDDRRGGGRIRMGDPPAEEHPPAPKPEKPQDASPQKSETGTWLALLSKWPSIEAKQASIRLAGQPATSFPLLEASLRTTTDDWRQVCGVAATLGKIGDARALDPLLAKLQDRRMFTHSGDLLDAITRIDSAGAKARLLTQLLHPASAVVDEAASRLRPRVGPPDAQPLRDILDAGGPAARAAAIDLLVRADPAAARTSLAVALRDTSPEVAFAAARALAADDAQEAEDILRRCTLAPVDRQVMYACVALALRGERLGRRTIDDATMRLLLGGRGLSGIDPLSKAAAAVALADLGYFHEVPALDDVLDQRLVPELIDVVAGRTFWADLKVFQPLALRRLQRLTGRSSGSSAQEWMAWWQQAAPSFRARRVLLEVPPDQWPSFSVTLRGTKAPGGESTIFAGSAEGLAYASPEDFAVLLPEADAKAFAAVVSASGLLRSSDSGTTGDGGAPVEAVIRSGRRERRLSFSGDAGAPGLKQVLDEADRLRRRHAWQRYRTQSQALDLPSFVAVMADQFAEDRPAAERGAALAQLITSALDDARGEAWNVDALDDLRAIPELGAALGEENTRNLLGRLGRKDQVDRVAEGIVLALARAQRSEAHPLLLEFLTTRPSSRAQDLMTQVFRDASQDALSSGLADERPAVRMAALASLDETSPRDLAESAVRKAMDEPDVGVRREAVRALGRLKCEWARADLESAASKPGDTRAAAVEALGRLGGRTALPALMSAFVSDDPGLRVTAVEALGATREPEAISWIAFAMSADPAPMVREVASRVLVAFGTERAAAELRRLALDRAQPALPRKSAVRGLVVITGRESLRDLARLVDDPADEVADEAAVSLATWRDPVAVPRLLKMLEEGRRVRDARTALEGISLEKFTQQDPQLVANLYSGWWETSRERGPRGWLMDALALDEIDDPVLRDWETGKVGREAVPFLLKGLRLESWPVRRATDLALRDIANKSFGDIGEFTTASESARVAAAWEDWWASQAPAEPPR